MRDPPDTAQLLALAAAAPASERPLAERVRAIAARERRYGDSEYDAIAAALGRLYGAGTGADLLRRLAADIRAGRFDAPGPARAMVASALRAHVAQRLRESNPAFLRTCASP
jgi:Domain of unknown function (DUF6285)